MPKTEYKTRYRELAEELFINNPNQQFSANGTVVISGKLIFTAI